VPGPLGSSAISFTAPEASCSGGASIGSIRPAANLGEGREADLVSGFFGGEFCRWWWWKPRVYGGGGGGGGAVYGWRGGGGF
jgi:hypothetical protein